MGNPLTLTHKTFFVFRYLQQQLVYCLTILNGIKRSSWNDSMMGTRISCSQKLGSLIHSENQSYKGQRYVLLSQNYLCFKCIHFRSKSNLNFIKIGIQLVCIDSNSIPYNHFSLIIYQMLLVIKIIHNSIILLMPLEYNDKTKSHATIS